LTYGDIKNLKVVRKSRFEILMERARISLTFLALLYWTSIEAVIVL